jgi:hypothetical protein
LGFTVNLWLSVEGDDPVTDLEDLSSWLRRERELRGQVQFAEQGPGPGELGSMATVLSVALGAGGALSVLAASLQAWFSQPRRSDVRVEIRGEDGRTVVIDAKRMADAEAFILSILDKVG